MQYHPLPVEQQAAVLWAMQNGYMDDVPVDRIKEYQAKLLDFLSTRKEAALAAVRNKKQIDDETGAALKSAVDEFKTTWR